VYFIKKIINILYNGIERRDIMKDKQENYFIDFLRFIFSLCILVYHGWLFAGEYGSGILNGGFLSVDFFFIVTGYLMINSLNKNSNKKKKESIMHESFYFVWNKLKRLIPALIVTFIIGLIFIYGIEILLNYKFILSNKVLPELFQLGIFGYKMEINSSWWYISAMLFVLELNYKKYYCIYIAPLIIAITLGFVNCFKININDPIPITFFLRNGFYKALIFIPLGNIAYLVTEKIKSMDFSKHKILFLSILEIVLYIILVLNMHFSYFGTFLFAILMMLNVSLTFSNITYSKNIFKHSIWKKLGNYGFYLFLCNISVRRYILKQYKGQNLTYRPLMIRFCIISLLTALLIYILVEIVYKKLFLKKIKKKEAK
jgi:peptidoglycan/LPS O-acetylase OafA/YrhL